MADTDHTPKMFAKFIQIVPFADKLWALDENGDLFWRDVINRSNNDTPVWRKSTTERES